MSREPEPFEKDDSVADQMCADSPWRSPAPLAKILFGLFVAAALLNGSMFWLRRVGFCDLHFSAVYEQRIHSECPDHSPTPEKSEALRVFTAEMYDVRGWLLVTKLFKDVVIAMFLSVSLVLVARGGIRGCVVGRWIAWRNVHFPVVLMAAIIAVSGIVTGMRHGLPLVLAGARSFLFLPLAVLGGWSVRRGGWRTFALCLCMLLPAQLALAPVELWRGMHLFRPYSLGRCAGDRIVGTMLQPSALGITAVVLTVACYTAGVRGLRLWAAGAAACILVFFAASATAWALLLLFAMIVVALRMTMQQRRRSVAAGLVIALLMIIGLPWLTGRADLYNSLWGRLHIAERQVAQVHSSWELFFGRGLGAGTNAAANLLMDWSTKEAAGYGERLVFIADSTPLCLFSQVGVVGCLLFYWILCIAAWRDRQMWPLYCVIGVGSLTVNIIELFPVNIVLGLCVARSLRQGSEREISQCAIPI